MKERLPAFDFIRTVCTLIIVAFHYSCHLNCRDFLPFYVSGSVSWGSTAVSIFFMISGSLLYYNNPEIRPDGLKKYFIKRWKAIFPLFYIAYAALFAVNAVRHGSIFYKGNPPLLILSALGLDGYFLYLTDNYYIIGEWFLGAIIILYLIYPALLRCFNKSELTVSAAVLCLYIFALTQDVFKIAVDRNLFSCLISFTAGMIIARHINYVKKSKAVLLPVSAVCMIILCAFRFDFSSNVLNRLSGIFLFFILLYTGEYIMKIPTADKTISEISRLSYAIYLLHHITILVILRLFDPDKPIFVILLLLFTTILIIGEALVLTNVIPVCRIMIEKLRSSRSEN